jgi:glutaredoxin
MNNKYYLHIIYLENCPYSQNALELLEEKKINYEITKVNHENKDKYKTDMINTFPQIYLKKEGKNDSLLLGGRDKLYKLYETIKNKEKIDEFSPKAIKRLSELFKFEK